MSTPGWICTCGHQNGGGNLWCRGCNGDVADVFENLRFDPTNDAKLLTAITLLNAARALGVVWDDEALRLVHNLNYTAAHLLRRIITPLADKDRSEAKEGS